MLEFFNENRMQVVAWPLIDDILHLILRDKSLCILLPGIFPSSVHIPELFWKPMFYHFLVGDVCFAPYVEVLIEMQIGERGELLQHCSPKNTHVHKIIHRTVFHIILKILQTRGTAVLEDTNN